jgi:hypothetical protein
MTPRLGTQAVNLCAQRASEPSLVTTAAAQKKPVAKRRVFPGKFLLSDYRSLESPIVMERKMQVNQKFAIVRKIFTLNTLFPGQEMLWAYFIFAGTAVDMINFPFRLS